MNSLVLNPYYYYYLHLDSLIYLFKLLMLINFSKFQKFFGRNWPNIIFHIKFVIFKSFGRVVELAKRYYLSKLKEAISSSYLQVCQFKRGDKPRCLVILWQCLHTYCCQVLHYSNSLQLLQI